MQQSFHCQSTEKEVNVTTFSSAIEDMKSKTSLKYQDKKIRRQSIQSPISSILLKYNSVKLIQQIQARRACQSKYLLFHLPYILLLCDTLLIQPNRRQSLIEKILQNQKDIVNRLKKVNFQQLPQNLVNQVINDIPKIFGCDRDYFRSKLQSFLRIYQQKMSTVLPYYYSMFELISKRNNYITCQSTIRQLDEIYNQKVEDIMLRYNNQDVQ